MKASKLAEDDDSDDEAIRKSPPEQKKRRLRLPSPARLPSLEEVLLTPSQEREFERKYLNIQGDTSQIVEIPRNDAFPSLQRSLRPTKNIGHGSAATRTVNMLAAIRNLPYDIDERHKLHLSVEDRRRGEAQAEKRSNFFRSPLQHPISSQHSLDDPTPAPQGLKRSAKHSNNTPQVDRTPIDLSSNEADADGNINDLIDDNVEEDVDAASLKSASPLTKPPKPFYQSQSKSSDINLDSEEDLPDFGTLVQKVGPAKATVLPHQSNEQSDSRRRKGARRVIEEDSDDE